MTLPGRDDHTVIACCSPLLQATSYSYSSRKRSLIHEKSLIDDYSRIDTSYYMTKLVLYCLLDSRGTGERGSSRFATAPSPVEYS